MNYFNPQLLAGHLNQCLSNPHNFLHLTPLLLSRSPTHFLLEVTFMAVGEPDYLFCIFYHLFSCRGSYLGSPLPMPLLIGPVPSTFEVFFFLWPFCLWCWSFHNVGRLSELLQSPTGHLKCHQVLNVSPLPLQEFAMVKENTDDSLGFSSSGNGATNWYFSQINTERTLLRKAHL